MLQGPDLIYRCGKCKELASRESLLSGNTFGAKNWSDMKREAPMLPDYPKVVICSLCGAINWLEDIEQVGEIDHPYGLWEPIAIPAPKEWQEAHFFRNPDKPGWIEALDNGLANTRERELYIRTRLWWAYNDPFRGTEEVLASRPQTLIDNLAALRLLQDTQVPEQALVAAECFREAGLFSDAVDLADQILSSSFEDKILRFANEIRSRSLLRDLMVFQL